MGGYGRPGRETGGGFCAVLFLCIVLSPLLMLGGCATFGAAPVYGDVPECEKLIPPSLLQPVAGVPFPDALMWPDGHEKAEPFEIALLGQTGQLEKSNERAPAVDHIYRTCLELHRNALAKAKRKWWQVL